MTRKRSESYDSEVTEKYLLEQECGGYVEDEECDTSYDEDEFEGEYMDIDSEGVPGAPGFWER
jgi:hypothetical protein